MSLKCSIDLESEGRKVGHFFIPCPRNDSAWGVLPIVIGHFKNGSGPKILLTGGAHGDEFEGPIALRKLMSKLQKIDFVGEIFIVPIMNTSAMKSGVRLSPIDQRDMNRSFRNDIEGTTAQITQFIMKELIDRVDIVLDFHSGGNSLDFLPSIIMHDLSDKKLREETLKALEAFNAPIGMILQEIDSKGMLDTYVEKKGKVFLTTELRGGGKLNKAALEVAESGLAKLLHHFGFISNLDDFSEQLRDFQTEYFDVPDEDCFVRSNEHEGIFESFVVLGDSVEKGDTVGVVHSIESLNLEGVPLKAKKSGVILSTRPRGRFGPGDSLLMIGQKRNKF